MIFSISRWKVHPFLALLVFGFLYAVASGIGPVESVGLLMEGFAKTLQWIAVIMIFGAMIGEIANETGGAERIAHATLQVAGKTFTSGHGFLGTPFVALLIGVLLALLQYGKSFRMERLAKVTERSIEKASLVIMITGAGGLSGT